MGLFFLQTSLFSVCSITTPYIIIRSLLSICFYCSTQTGSSVLPKTTKVHERTRIPSSFSSIEPSGIPFLISSNLRRRTTRTSSSSS
jgi:hypothetical protein